MQKPIELTIGELLNKIKRESIKFYIPGYQRGYKWTNIQAGQLIDDLITYGRDQHLIDNEGKYHNQDNASAYYLQPIAVCPKPFPKTFYPPHYDTSDSPYDIIDGQQRLTTIWLLLYTCFNKKKNNNIEKPNYSIKYESFDDWQDEFMKCVNSGDFDTFKKKSLNHFHIHEVYNTFVSRINSRGKNKNNKNNKIKAQSLYDLLLNHTKIIWSDISSGQNDKSDDIKTFTNLNSGKIPLTCGELIKGLVLQKGKFNKVSAIADSSIHSEEQRLMSAIKALIQNSKDAKQLYDRISNEWDIFERELHDESLWHFIYNKETNYVFDTRLEYIFNLVENVGFGDESMTAFNKLYDRMNDDSLKEIDKFWEDVSKYMATIKEWYKEKEYYHLIGYLVATTPWIKDNNATTTVISYLINGLYQKEKEWNKSDLRGEIKKLINKSLEESEEDSGETKDITSIESLRYTDGKDKKTIKKLLLFFNIHTILMQEGDERFPFNRYKEESWDIEHIASQTDFKAFKKDTNEAKLWALYLLQYFTGLNADNYIEQGKIKKGKNSFVGKKVRELADSDRNEIYSVIRSTYPRGNNNCQNDKLGLIAIVFAFLFGKGSLGNVEEKIKNLGFVDEEMEDDEKHKVGNLTLLNMSINRSYGNSIFPVKRMIIQEEMQNGYFVPPCTQRVFQKAYSRKFDQLYVWSKADADAYTESIKTALETFNKIEGTYAEYKAQNK